jgi:hypothetical protein
MTENKEEEDDRSKTIEILKVVVPVIGTILVAAFALLQIVIPTILANQATQTAVAIQRTDTAVAIQRTDTAVAIQRTDTAEANQAAQTAEANQAAQTAEANQAAQTAEANQAAQTAEANQAAQTAEANQAAQTAEANQAAQTAEANQAAQTAEANRPTQVVREASAPPTNIPIPSDAPTPSVATLTCDDEPEDPKFSRYWTGEVRENLGCPELPAIEPANAVGGKFAEQRFDNGFMVWVPSKEDGELFFALIDKNEKWVQSKLKIIIALSNFDDEKPSPICNSDQKPHQEYGPRSGFSVLWCSEDLPSAIGQATGYQYPSDKGLLLKFEKGYMLRDAKGDDYILYRDGDRVTTERGTYVQK